MTTTTTRDTRTAQQTYDENMAAIQAAIRKLQAGLKKHRKEQAKDARSYGYAGDASYVLDLLDQAARFINGEDE
jgi:hypothetical protein